MRAKGLLAILAVVLLLAMAASASVGVAEAGLPVAFRALFAYDAENSAHQLIREIRLPRTVGAALLGLGFALAGAIMQRISNNPFADTGLLGINAGAGFFVALALALWKSIPFQGILAVAFLGACLGAALVYMIGGAPGKQSPLRLVLAGAAVSAFLNALGQGIALCFGLSRDMSYWNSGSLSGTSWQELAVAAPIFLLALVGALLLSPSLCVLAMGEESAVGLGLNLRRVRGLGLLLALVMAGGGVALAGGISFLGLIAPHIARMLVGSDDRRSMPVSALLGAIILVLADLCARVINAPFDTPVGALVSVLGVPLFLLLTYRRRGEAG